MFAIKTVGQRDMDFVPAIIASLITTDKQDGIAARVESVECAQWSSKVLRSQFTHVAVPGAVDSAAVRKTQMRATYLQQVN